MGLLDDPICSSSQILAWTTMLAELIKLIVVICYFFEMDAIKGTSSFVENVRKTTTTALNVM